MYKILSISNQLDNFIRLIIKFQNRWQNLDFFIYLGWEQIKKLTPDLIYHNVDYIISYYNEPWLVEKPFTCV